MKIPEYQFKNPNSLIFMTGVALSGKSTLAPMIASAIGCETLNMDVLRLLSQDFEALKPESERSPFVHKGSCDSYTLVGNGEYSSQALIDGFNNYSHAVSQLLLSIMPRMEIQGVQDILIEGVQLTPQIVGPHLSESKKLIIVKSTEAKLASNRQRLYQGDSFMEARYSIDKLLILQEEILRQVGSLPGEHYFIVENSSTPLYAVNSIIGYLLATVVIESRSQEFLSPI